MGVLPILAKLKGLVSGGNGGLIEKIGDAIDKNVTNKEEIMILQNELVKINNEFEAKMAQAEVDMEGEITKRWEADMESDNWLSKNTRPLTMLSLLLFTFVIIIADSMGIDFEVKESYVTLLETLLITVVVAYFGSRGVEKFQKIRGVKNANG